jgi:hypothetical protein
LNQSLRLAPTLGTGVAYVIMPWLRVNFAGFGQYRWYRYAEQAGRFSGMNTQWVSGTSVGLSSTLLDESNWGRLTLALGLNSRWSRRYASRATYESAQSDTNHWSQGFGWNTRLSYTPRQWVTAHVGLQHGSPLRRNGIINPILIHRDQTQIDTGISFTY